MKKFKLRARDAKRAIKEYLVLVDDEDAHFLRNHLWFVATKNGCSYPVTSYQGAPITLGQMIFGGAHRDSRQHHRVRYINGDRFDNRRENLFLEERGYTVTEVE